MAEALCSLVKNGNNPRWYSVNVNDTTTAAGSWYRVVATVSTTEDLSGKKIIPTFMPSTSVYGVPAINDLQNGNKDIRISLNRHSNATIEGTLYIQVFD